MEAHGPIGLRFIEKVFVHSFHMARMLNAV